MKKFLFGALTLALLCAANVASAQKTQTFKASARSMTAQGKPTADSSAAGVSSYGMEAQNASPDKIRSDSSTGVVEVALDRADLTYTEGDLAEIVVRSSVGGYLYLISFDCQGEPTLLFPNEWNQNNRIKAGESITYPAEDQDFVLRIVGPRFGEEKIRAYVTREEIEELKGIKYGKNATDISGVMGKLEKALQTRADKDYRNSKSIQPEARPAADEYELTVGQCVYWTQSSSGSATQRGVNKTGRRVFVGFGVDKYQDKRIRNLRCCARDAQAMGQIAVERLGVSEDCCVVLTDGEVTLAKASRIFNEVLPDFTRPGDTIFIYWSGHGDKSASGTTRENDCFLVPSDADVNDPRTMLNEHAFGNWLKDNLTGRDIILFLDACHSGGMLLGNGNLRADSKGLEGESSDAKKGTSLIELVNGESSDSKNLGELVRGDSKAASEGFVFDFGCDSTAALSKSLGHVGMFAMASSSMKQLSWEGSGSIKLSVATHYLIETLRTADSSLTHKDLVPKIRPKVSSYVRKNRPNSDQTVVANDQLNPAVRLIAK